MLKQRAPAVHTIDDRTLKWPRPSTEKFIPRSPDGDAPW
jgi:hypothetical protein